MQYSNVRFSDTDENYKGSYTSHFLKAGISYFGIQVTDSYRLLTGATFDLPLAGQAEVTRKSDSQSKSSGDFGGWASGAEPSEAGGKILGERNEKVNGRAGCGARPLGRGVSGC